MIDIVKPSISPILVNVFSQHSAIFLVVVLDVLFLVGSTTLKHKNRQISYYRSSNDFPNVSLLTAWSRIMPNHFTASTRTLHRFNQNFKCWVFYQPIIHITVIGFCIHEKFFKALIVSNRIEITTPIKRRALKLSMCEGPLYRWQIVRRSTALGDQRFALLWRIMACWTYFIIIFYFIFYIKMEKSVLLLTLRVSFSFLN